MTKSDLSYGVELDLFTCFWFYPNNNQRVKKGYLNFCKKQISVKRQLGYKAGDIQWLNIVVDSAL